MHPQQGRLPYGALRQAVSTVTVQSSPPPGSSCSMPPAGPPSLRGATPGGKYCTLYSPHRHLAPAVLCLQLFFVLTSGISSSQDKASYSKSMVSLPSLFLSCCLCSQQGAKPYATIPLITRRHVLNLDVLFAFSRAQNCC
jgi:hypothetical protein